MSMRYIRKPDCLHMVDLLDCIKFAAKKYDDENLKHYIILLEYHLKTAINVMYPKVELHTPKLEIND